MPPPQQQLTDSQKKHPQQVTLNTTEQQPASVQHLSTKLLALGHTDTRSSRRQAVGSEHENELFDFTEALTNGREQPKVHNTPEEDTCLRTVKRHHADVYQWLFILKNHVDSLVTDMQTIMKEMSAIGREQNDQIYDCSC